MTDSQGQNDDLNGQLSRMSLTNEQPEKPNHEYYLNEFRVEACPLFKNHQCAQHRPFTCFKWHFPNQKRRRPFRTSDGQFNYSPDIYCDKYDENNGTCPDGEDCPFLHRVAGDVERKYHLRYYKTAHCTYPNDARGQCSKNGIHCAFAHTQKDKRNATIARAPFAERNDGFLIDGNDKEIVCFSTDDPKWNMSNHDQVLSFYKTEQCQKPARLCRQGYACPYYHNSKDRRRPPGTYRYRSTPCPAARTIDEWLDPDLCESADNCQYCHTRTEQQFHPEIYKSTKCNDMLENGFCPRSVFCAFAHHDSELHEQRNPYSAKPSPVPQCSPNGRRSSGNGCPIPTEPTRFEPMSTSFPNGPPGLERPMIMGFDFQEDPRLRAQTINMGHLDILKRNMILGGNYQMNQGHPSNISLYTNDSGQGMTSLETLDQMNMDMIQERSIQERCHFLEQALEQERQNCEMWKMRYEGEYIEKARLQNQIEQMRHMIGPLAVRMPEDNYTRIPEESYSIRPSASLPHSPSYNIFETDPDHGAPACARCGRDPTGGNGQNSCPVCSN